MTTPKVTITGEELLDVLNSTKEIVLDRYVSIRRRYRLDHDQAKRFAANKSMHIDSYQRGVNHGLDFEDMYQLAESGYNMRLVFNAMDVGSTLEQAKEAIDLRALTGNDHTYIRLLTDKHSHDKIISVTRAIIAAKVTMPSDVYSLVFRYGLDVDKAIAAVEAEIRPGDYDWAMKENITHDEILEVVRLAPRMIYDYVRNRQHRDLFPDHITALRAVIVRT